MIKSKNVFLLVLLFSVTSYGSISWEQIEKESFDKNLPVAKRWKALMNSTEAPVKKRDQILKRAYQSHEWLMKNGALIAMKKVDPQKATLWAGKLLTDRAMMVRMAAVGVLNDLGAKKSEGLLWKSLNHPHQFHKGVGLPSRRSVVRALWKVSRDKKRWQSLLTDSDERIRQMAGAKLSQQ